jgi:hypothetical protein
MIISLYRRSLWVGAFFLWCFIPVVSAEEYQLRNDELAQTEQGRQLLKYMVSCALPAGESIVVTVDEKYIFQGALGLVPDWAHQPMTEEEKRRLSSCLAAHTNFFGKPVQISLRSDDPAASESLRTTAEERANFPFFEGGFFGNYFIPHPVSYVCLGDTPVERDQHLASLLRVCTIKNEGDTELSRCDFKVVGLCKDKPFVQDGVDYSKEVLWVYLPEPGRDEADKTR